MEGFYEVIHGETPVGKAELKRHGLYWEVTCRCKIPDSGVHRLVAAWSDGWQNLGIPVPDADGFMLKKNLPVKHLGENNLRFVLLKLTEDPGDVLFPKQLQEEPITDRPEYDIPMIPENFAEEASVEKAEDIAMIFEDEPFERLPEIMNAKLESRDGTPVAVFSQDDSDVQTEANGTMIGAQDISVDGSGSNPVTDPV